MTDTRQTCVKIEAFGEHYRLISPAEIPDDLLRAIELSINKILVAWGFTESTVKAETVCRLTAAERAL